MSTINLRPKKLTIYKRPKSPLWQCRYKLDKGEWYRQSTGTDDQAEAEDIAFKLYYGADERDKNNLPQTPASLSMLLAMPSLVCVMNLMLVVEKSFIKITSASLTTTLFFISERKRLIA